MADAEIATGLLISASAMSYSSDVGRTRMVVPFFSFLMGMGRGSR